MRDASLQMLPDPSAEQLDSSEQLQQLITEEINTHGGWIGFDHFMHLALYTPELGYYNGLLQKLGAHGDFITAPLLGRLFGQCVARQCAQVLRQVESGNIYEFGAGDGSLVKILLEELVLLDAIPENYFITETSPSLRQRQQSMVGNLPAKLRKRVHWMDHLPDSVRGVVVANELLDALPCKRFEVGGSGKIYELGVALSHGKFIWRRSEEELTGINWLRGLALKSGYCSELPQQASSWVGTVAALIEQGFLLLVDYGFPRQEFYHHDRDQGTLMCHYRHHVHTDPFYLAGLQDITTHIDFTAVAQAGIQSGLEILGYCDQANFLLSCGLMDILADFQESGKLSTNEMLSLSAEVKKLTMPHEMGELFKVIALGKGVQQPLIGFKMKNNMVRLSDV